MLCEGFCVNRKATLGSTVKPVEGGRGEERDSRMRGMRWMWGSNSVLVDGRKYLEKESIEGGGGGALLVHPENRTRKRCKTC